jgi:hypothetical protein
MASLCWTHVAAKEIVRSAGLHKHTLSCVGGIKFDHHNHKKNNLRFLQRMRNATQKCSQNLFRVLCFNVVIWLQDCRIGIFLLLYVCYFWDSDLLHQKYIDCNLSDVKPSSSVQNCSEYRGGSFLRNVGKFIPDYPIWHPRLTLWVFGDCVFITSSRMQSFISRNKFRNVKRSSPQAPC